MKALTERLGYYGTLRFLEQFEIGYGDYVDAGILSAQISRNMRIRSSGNYYFYGFDIIHDSASRIFSIIVLLLSGPAGYLPSFI